MAETVQIIITAAPATDSTPASVTGVGPGGAPLGIVKPQQGAGASIVVPAGPMQEAHKRANERAGNAANQTTSSERGAAKKLPVANKAPAAPITTSEWLAAMRRPDGKTMTLQELARHLMGRGSGAPTPIDASAAKVAANSDAGAVAAMGGIWADRAGRLRDKTGGFVGMGGSSPKSTPRAKSKAAAGVQAAGGAGASVLDAAIGRESVKRLSNAPGARYKVQYSKSPVVRILETSGIRGAGRLMSSSVGMVMTGVVMMLADKYGDEAQANIDRLQKTEKDFLRSIENRTGAERSPLVRARGEEMRSNIVTTTTTKGMVTGAAIGYAAGTVIGTAIGAFIGSVIPGAGTVVGAGIGALVGQTIGVAIGTSVGGFLGYSAGQEEAAIAVKNLRLKAATPRQLLRSGEFAVDESDRLFNNYIVNNFTDSVAKAFVPPVTTGALGVGYAKIRARTIAEAQGLDQLFASFANAAMKLAEIRSGAIFARA